MKNGEKRSTIPTFVDENTNSGISPCWKIKRLEPWPKEISYRNTMTFDIIKMVLTTGKLLDRVVSRRGIIR